MAERQHCRNSNSFKIKTKFSKCTFDFSWSIENSSFWCVGTKLTSPEFHSINNQVFYATLENKHDKDDRTWLTFYKKSESDTMPNKFNLFITDSSGENIFYNLSSHCEHYEKSCTFVFLTNSLTKFSNATSDQILIFKCTMEMDKFNTDMGENYTTPSPSNNLSVLVDNLKSMYTTSLYTDITLQVGDTGIHVHKALLCARSPVFAKMFESPMAEDKENTIAIPDIELPVMKNLLEFLYTGKLLAEDFESVYALYYAADKYDVSSLRETCVGELLSKMDVKNACLVLSLANKHSDVQFKVSAMDFIQLHFDEIMETDDWKEFLADETKLAADVMWIRCCSSKPKVVNHVK